MWVQHTEGGPSFPAAAETVCQHTPAPPPCCHVCCAHATNKPKASSRVINPTQSCQVRLGESHRQAPHRQALPTRRVLPLPLCVHTTRTVPCCPSTPPSMSTTQLVRPLLAHSQDTQPFRHYSHKPVSRCQRRTRNVSVNTLQHTLERRAS